MSNADMLSNAKELALFWHPICHSFSQGLTVLPPFLGIGEQNCQALLDDLALSGAPVSLSIQHKNHPIRQLRHDIAQLRQQETQELMQLLRQNANPTSNYSLFAAAVIAHGCLGNQHLWKDLGLPERPRLSQLVAWYFPPLFAGNNRNMRWKRFLYKQLCESGGDYICRAPSCEQCSSYDECFGPET